MIDPNQLKSEAAKVAVAKAMERLHAFQNEDGDEHARDVVMALNRLPGVCTLWCCQGHEDEERPILYYSCVATDEGFAAMRTLYERVFPELSAVKDTAGPDNWGSLSDDWTLSLEIGYLYEPDCEQWYQVISFKLDRPMTDGEFMYVNQLIARKANELADLLTVVI